MQYVPPESIGNAVRNYRNKVKSFGSGSERILSSIELRYQELYRSKTRVQEWNDEIEDIIDRIKGKEDMKKFEVELGDVKARLKT